MCVRLPLPIRPDNLAFRSAVRKPRNATRQARSDRWYRLRSYLDSAATHGITTLDAISSAIAGKLWLPPLPAVS